MDLKSLRSAQAVSIVREFAGRRAGTAFAALLSLTFCASNMYAFSLASTSSPAVACNTATGPGAAANILIKPATPLTGANTLAVSFTAPGGGLVVTAPQVTTLSTANQAAGLTFTVAVVAGCAGASTGSTGVQFKVGSTNDITVSVADTVTATASALAASAVTITCGKNGSTYTPGSAQTVSVTSAAAGGTPFTVDTVTNGPPAWLTVTPTTGGAATSSPVTFSVAAAAGCGAFNVGTSNVATLHLLNAPAPDRLVTVTLQIVPPSPLVATPAPATLTYVKGSGTPGYVDLHVTSALSPAPFFALNTASLPIWLTVDTTTGTAPKNIRFSSTSVCDTLAPGTYTANVYLKVSGYADFAVPVSLLINNKAPRLSVAEGTTRNISWTIGQPIPAPFITAVSSDSPISYTATTGGTLAPIVSSTQQSGLAYSFGTQIGVAFNPLIFAAAQPGSVLTGTVTLTWGVPSSTIVVTFNITIQSPGATVTGLSPASLPTASAGQVFTVVLTGTGFVPSTDPTQKTKVGVVISNAVVADTNISANAVNPSNIILTITVPVVPDVNLPFAVSGAGGTVVLGICNPGGGSCSIPSGTVSLTIGSGPIVQAVTSASAFVQVTPPAFPSIAPYDMISIFGANFCSSAGTGCGSSQVLSGVQDPVTLRYASSVTPDAAGPTQRSLTVTFQTHGGSPTPIATAPVLFAANGQINLMVPAAVSTYVGSQVDIVASFGYGSGATLKSSAPFPVNVVATDPGIFTVGSSGQGDGAALSSTYSLISSGNPAGMRSTASDSDTVSIYMTGLGAPDGTANNASAGSAYVWSSDCITPASYYASLNNAVGSSLTNIDGAIIQSALLNTNRLPPCIATASTDVPSVTIGGVAGTVLYAGFVPDSVAGLYQINVTLPGSTAGSFTTSAGATISTVTAPVQLPVVVTANSVTSQTGVNLWVQPRLKLTGPSGGGLTGTVGLPWSSSNNVVVATEGTSPYHYSLTSGLLPSGLTLNASTGAITGTPAANTGGTYAVTVTGADSANIPVKGAVSFTLTVAGGLFTTSSNAGPFNYTFGSAHANLNTVTATGGAYPYAYVLTTAANNGLPTGMTVNASTGAVGITALTPAGTYHVTVTATDSTGGTPLTGSASFDIAVALNLSRTSPVTGTAGQAGAISTVSTLGGNTGSVTYSLANGSPSYVSVDANTGVVSIDNTATASSVTVTVNATDGGTATGSSNAAVGSITVLVAVQ